MGNRSSLTVVAEGDVIDDQVEVQLLANLIGMPAQAVRRKLQDTTEGYQSPRTVSVDVSRRVVAFIGEHPEAFPGVTVQQRTQRSYPHGSLAAHVVGYVGTVTEDQLKAGEENEDGTITYRSGGRRGPVGRRAHVRERPRGQPRRADRPSSMRRGASSGTRPASSPSPGSDVVLTIDLDIQKAAEESLEKIVTTQREAGQRCYSGSVVALGLHHGRGDCDGELPDLLAQRVHRRHLAGGLGRALG